MPVVSRCYRRCSPTSKPLEFKGLIPIISQKKSRGRRATPRSLAHRAHGHRTGPETVARLHSLTVSQVDAEPGEAPTAARKRTGRGHEPETVTQSRSVTISQIDAAGRGEAPSAVRKRTGRGDAQKTVKQFHSLTASQPLFRRAGAQDRFASRAGRANFRLVTG